MRMHTALILSLFLSNLAIGIGIMTQLPPGANPAWEFMVSHLGIWAIGIPFLLVAFWGLLGFKDDKYLRGALFLGSGLMVVWALASIWAWVFVGAPTVLNALFLGNVAVLKYTLAIWSPRLHAVSAIAHGMEDNGLSKLAPR